METFFLISDEICKDVSPHINKHVFYVSHAPIYIKSPFLLFAFKYFVLFFFKFPVCNFNSNTSKEECVFCLGNCKDDIPCTNLTGVCANGCKNYWTGEYCQGVQFVSFFFSSKDIICISKNYYANDYWYFMLSLKQYELNFFRILFCCRNLLV